MQVKKFEAKTMKEALQLVKQELGPEAIILSAKDNKKSFGLAGRGSVEITAAISEKSMQKRQYTESRLPENAREKFRNQSAKKQRNLIENTVNKYTERQLERAPMRGHGAGSNVPQPRRLGAIDTQGLGATARRPVTARRYIDIDDEDPQAREPQLSGRRVEDLLEEFSKQDLFILGDGQMPASASRRVAPAFNATAEKENGQSAHARNAAEGSVQHANTEVLSLRKEVDALRDLLSQFQVGGVHHQQPVTRHPGAEYGLPFELAAQFEKLQLAGIEVKYIVEILEKANEELTPLEKKKKSLVDAWVARYILSHTSVVNHWLKPTPGCQVHVFVGPGGHGKTSAVVKIASHLVLNEKKKVAIFTTDTFKVGAADQLKIYAQILNLPFETVKHTIEFQNLLKRYAAYDVILIDSPGFSLKDIQEIDMIRTLLPQRDVAKQTHLVLSCASKEIDAYEACHRYQMTHFDDVLVTKLDESFVHGFLYNIQRKTEKPLYGFGLGQKIPEDIELATRERVIDLIYKITKNTKITGA